MRGNKIGKWFKAATVIAVVIVSIVLPGSTAIADIETTSITKKIITNELKTVSPQIDNLKTKPISSPEDDGATDVTSVLTEADIPEDDPEDFIYGDANGDGTINLGDIEMIVWQHSEF